MPDMQVHLPAKIKAHGKFGGSSYHRLTVKFRLALTFAGGIEETARTSYDL